MTTTVIITAHPVLPNNTVTVTRHDPDDQVLPHATWVLEKGAVLSTCVSGGQSIFIEETSTLIVGAPNA